MAAAGDILVRTMRLLEGKVREGVTTAELDEAAERFIRSQGATPAFKGYRGFPGSICASPNSLVVHGFPGPEPLAARRHHLRSTSGSSRTAGSPTRRAPSPSAPSARWPASCSSVTQQALFDAVEQCRPGNRLGDVSHAVQARVEGEGMSVIRSLVGHGIGRVDARGPAGARTSASRAEGPRLEEGMVLAVEPMVNAGRHQVRMGDDGWAIYSQDGSLAAHFEFTIAVTAEGPRVLTPWHEADAQALAGEARTGS